MVFVVASKFIKKFYIASSKWNFQFVCTLLLVEACLCILIVKNVSYTEIDWKAYMQEVTTWQEGERDYMKIRGDTGPLVYPAGFLYLYGTLKYLAGGDGTDILKAQWMFVVFYLISTATVMYLYTLGRKSVPFLAKSKNARTKDTIEQPLNLKNEDELKLSHNVWSWRVIMVICSLSKRLHSIFVLRLFNDGLAMLLLYVSIAYFARSFWRVGCVFFSLAVSIKMNVLLFAPGLLLLLLQANSTLMGTIQCLAICAIIQMVLGLPFLLTHPISYLRKAFEFDRVFFYKWTVNWKFLAEETFLSKYLSVMLLLLHIGFLSLFCIKWLRVAKRQTGRRLFISQTLSPTYVIYTMFVSNFVGIAFARTLHYQFYSWYFQTVPFMVWISFPRTFTAKCIGIIIIVSLEYAFHVFPATSRSSGLLQISHLIILARLSVSDIPRLLGTATTSEEAKKIS